MELYTKDLCVRFATRSGDIPAVNHVSLAFSERQVTGIIGETGSGKSVQMCIRDRRKPLHLLFCCPAAECLQCLVPQWPGAGGLGIPEPLGQFQKAHGRRPVRFQMVYGGMQIIRLSLIHISAGEL